MVAAIVRYVLSSLFKVSQYWYSNEAITNLATSSEPAIIITSNVAPANNLDRPLTE